MKKMLFSSVLGLLAVAAWAAPSQAGTFCLIPDHCWPWCCGCGCDTSTITIHAYNAFSPVACGSMCFNGCNPFCNSNQGFNPGCCPGGLNSGYLPAYNGCPADSSTPTVVTPTAPAPATAPATTSQAQPYPGPVAAPGAYGFAPTIPQSVMPNAGQQFYPAGYCR